LASPAAKISASARTAPSVVTAATDPDPADPADPLSAQAPASATDALVAAPASPAETQGLLAAPLALATAPASTDPVSSPITPSQTVANLSAQIVGQADQKSSRFDVQLTPEGLGRVDVAVQIDASGKVTASLSFEKADAAALVKDHSDDLQAAMSSAGLSLAPGALKISHVGVDGFTALATGPAEQGIAASSSSSTETNTNTGQGGSPQGQSFTGGTHAFQQGAGQQSASQQGAGQQGQGQQGQHARPSFGGARSFEQAASAADVVDRQAAYSAGLSARGLDIRI
jgi:hypothetical protein